jgi:hypothetical protein
MSRLCLMLCRLCLAAWFGAGVMFLGIVLGLRNSPLFSDEVRFNHPRVLFPLYYSLEFLLLIVATVAAWLMVKTNTAATRRRSLAAVAVFSTVALAGALTDYFAVYRPLASMLESQVLTQQFVTLHHASRWINTAVLLLSGMAAGWACWIEPPSSSQKTATSR